MVLTELGLEWRRSFGDSLPADELLALMQALFSEWTLFTWLAGFSNGSKPLWVRCTLTFLSSGMVSRGLTTESVPWQLRVDIFVTHICQKGTEDEREKIKVSIKEKNPSVITSVQPKTDCAPAFQILPVFHLSVSLSLFPPVEPCCYPSARMRAFLSPSLFSLIQTAPSFVDSAAYTHCWLLLLLFPYCIHTIPPYLWHTSTYPYNCADMLLRYCLLQVHQTHT